MREPATMRRLAIPVVLVLLLGIVPAGQGASAEGPGVGWREILTIDTATAGAKKAFEAFDTASLNLYDFNGDGQLEIVANNDNNVAYVLDSRTGKALAQIQTYLYDNPRWPVRELNPVAIGNLYGDGVPCMVIPNSAAFMSAWCYNAGASTRDNFVFDKKWEIRVDAAKYEPDFKEAHPWLYSENGTVKKGYGVGLDGNAYLADSDGDGKMEIYVETDGWPGQFAFNHDGTYRWSHSWWDGNGGAKVLDIDKDGSKEAVFVSDGGIVSAYSARSGNLKWAFHASHHGAKPGSVPVPPLVADLHGDGHYEIVFGARNVAQDHETNPNWINESHAYYFALDSKGRMLWNVSYDWMNPLQYNHPAPADVNKDGVLDIVFLDWNTVGHKPGDWEPTNRKSNLFVLDGRDGSPIWRTGVSIYWSNKDFVIADVDGDRSQDIVVPQSKSNNEGLGIYDLYTGAYKGWFPISWTLSRGPVAGDLYGDGKLYLVAPVNKKITDRPNYRNLDVGLREGQLRIIETGANYDALFSANFLLSEDQEETQPKGSTGQAPPTPTGPPPVTATPTPGEVEPTPGQIPSNERPTGATPTVDPTPNGSSPTPAENAATVPGPGLALLVAAAVAVAVAARRRR